VDHLKHDISIAFPGQRLTGGLIIADDEGQLVEWSDEAVRLHGYKSIVEVRRHVTEFASTFSVSRPGGPPLPFEEWPLPKLMRGEPVDNYELCLRRLDTGQEWIINYSGVRVNIPGQAKALYVLTLQDVTGWHRAHEVVRESEERLHQLADAMPQIVWTARADGHIDYYNRRWYEFTGSVPGDGSDESWLPLLHPDDVQSCLDRWHSAVRSGTPYQTEYRFRDHRTGEYRWQLGRALPIRDADGHISKWFGTSTDIDDLKRASAALRDSEVRLRGVVDAAADGILTFDEAGVIEAANPAVQDIFGYPVHDLIGQHVSVLIPQFNSEYLMEFNGSERAREREALGCRSDANLFPLDVSISEMTLAGRRLFTGIVRDITARKEAERRLRDKHTLLRTIVEGITDPLYVKNADGRFRYVNAPVARMAGRATEECIGADAVEIFGSEFGNQVRDIDRQVLQSSGPLSYEQVINVEGEQRHFLVTKLAFRNVDGEAAGLVGFSRDITSHKRAEAALKSSEQHLRDVMDSIPVAVVVLSIDGRVIEMNAGAKHLLDADRMTFEQVRNRAWNDLPWLSSSPDQSEMLAAAFSRAATGEAVRLASTNVTRGATTASFDLALAPMRDGDGEIRHLIFSAIDVTERKLAEAQARAQQAELAHMERVQTMGHMASGLAHELNQPLGAIVNYAGAARQAITRGSANLDSLNELLADVVGEASRAGEIIRRLRNFVQKQRPHIQPTDVLSLINDPLRILAYDLRQTNVVPQIVAQDDLPRVLADSVQISQVIVNLVRNALDAMHDIQPANRCLKIVAERQPDEGVRISVIDCGKGLSPAAIGRIFDAFYTTKSSGLGMGLALCRMIIEDHGGHIIAESDASGGMQFSFTLRTAGETKVADGTRPESLCR
jgi:PAS domain S-box-containing protein